MEKDAAAWGRNVPFPIELMILSMNPLNSKINRNDTVRDCYRMITNLLNFFLSLQLSQNENYQCF